MDDIDRELARVLLRHGVELRAYLTMPDVYYDAPLPRGTMDARAYLSLLDAVERELNGLEDARTLADRHLGEAFAHAASMGLSLYDAQSTLARDFEARRRALHARRVRLVTRWRPIDAEAFRTAVAPLLKNRLEALAALARATVTCP